MKKALSVASLALLSVTGNVMAKCSDISWDTLNNAVKTAASAGTATGNLEKLLVLVD